MKLSNCWAADFETTTDPNDCRVWAYSICNIADPSVFYWGTSIEEFFEWLELRDAQNFRLFYHNLKFDGFFLLNYLAANGYAWIEDRKLRKDKTFTTLITDTGQYYSIEVYFKVTATETHKVTFLDSLKIFPNFSVDSIAKGFNLPIQKLKIDYDKFRPVGYQLDENEINYIRNDVEIMARALKIMFEQGHTKMTIASDAMSYFRKHTIGFRKKFPKLDDAVDADIRMSYRGGFTYANDVWQGKKVGAGVCLDVTSLYPSVMRYQPMPYGEPVFFDGQYQPDDLYPLYVQAVYCTFEIKPGKIPSIQLKNNLSFMPNEYIKSSGGRPVRLVLTKPDFELFLEQYDVNIIEYMGGWKFMATTGLFDNYVDYWVEQKAKASKEGNAPLRQISKLLLNSLYGRFGISGIAYQKTPYVSTDGTVKFINSEPEHRETCYIPVACFVTGFGRSRIIHASQAVRDYTIKKYGEDRYYYSDTDSIKAGLTDEDLEALKDIILIDDYKLGYFKKEENFEAALFIRQKCYIQQTDGKIHATVAGLPKYLAPLINFDNFKRGFTTAGMTQEDLVRLARENGATDEEVEAIHHKKTYQYVKGGVILADTDFTIQ